MTKQRVTQRDLALAAGVTQSAVSLALRGSSRISLEQREHILSIAKQLQYHNDPLASGLARQKQKKSLPQIAYLGTQTKGPDNYALALQRILKPSARSVYLVPVNRQQDANLSDDLHNRGITGVLIGQANTDADAWSTPWLNMAQVHCGVFRAPSTGDIIAHDLFSAPRQLLAHAHSCGFFKIAALLPVSAKDSLSEELLLGGLLSLQHQDSVAFKVWSGSNVSDGLKWLDCEAGEAEIILCYDKACLSRLRAGGERRPCMVLVLDNPEPTDTGLMIDYERIMQRALFRLDEKMHQGFFGPSAERELTLLPMKLHAKS